MAIDLTRIIRTLEAIETRHPDTRDELAPIIAALTATDRVLLDVEQVRQIIGLPSPTTVTEWIRLGLLAAEPGVEPGQWRIPLARHRGSGAGRPRWRRLAVVS